jgi:hypothetical protein
VHERVHTATHAGDLMIGMDTASKSFKTSPRERGVHRAVGMLQSERTRH